MERKGGKKVLHGRDVPTNTSVSFQIDEGMLVPVVWHLGPVFCGYCANFKSRSWQAVYKHIASQHSEEAKNHEMNVRRETLNFPEGADGLCVVCHGQVENRSNEGGESNVDINGTLVHQNDSIVDRNDSIIGEPRKKKRPQHLVHSLASNKR